MDYFIFYILFSGVALTEVDAGDADGGEGEDDREGAEEEEEVAEPEEGVLLEEVGAVLDPHRCQVPVRTTDQWRRPPGMAQCESRQVMQLVNVAASTWQRENHKPYDTLLGAAVDTTIDFSSYCLHIMMERW